MTRAIAIGVIAPHGDLGIADACDEATRDLATATQQALDTVGRRVAESGADCVVLATPHGVHVASHFAVVTAGSATGRLDDSPRPVGLSVTVDTELAAAVSTAAGERGLPSVRVSYGGNTAAEAVMPLDWGSLIPLWHILRHAPGLPVVLVSPARELSAAAHVEFGEAVADAGRVLSRRVAFVASADQGHGHSAVGRYGYRAESAVFDRRITDIVRRGALDELTEIAPAEVGDALADSWWQMLMLVGALGHGSGNQSEVLAYEAPTYYGMLTALVTPAA